MDVRVTHTNHLVALVAQVSAAAGRLADLPAAELDRLRAEARRDSARLSARLDGSPLEPATADAVDAQQWQRPGELMSHAAGPGGWAAALRLDGMATQDVAAVEYANLLDAYDAESRLAEVFFDDPLATLAALHGLLCQGLVDPEVVGRLRTTEQAVHDGAQGRVIFNPPDPPALPALLDGLQDWLRGAAGEGSAAFTAPVVAAVVHEVLLQWQPYEAANGRLARAAARLILRAREFDPGGIVVVEQEWAQDPGAYYTEVAATIRRRGDLTVWVERHTEALTRAVDRTVAAVHPSRADLPERALAAAAGWRAGQALTVAEYAAHEGISRETAWRDLRALAAAGLVVAEPRTLGRKFRKPTAV